MYFTGFADEASKDFDRQLAVTKALGWENTETRSLMGGNLASISDADFAVVAEKLADSGINFNCYGSGIANWSQPITEPAEASYEELRRAIPRLQQLHIPMVRIMSFAIPEELRPNAMEYFAEVIKRLKVLVKMAEDAGITLVHENCDNWGSLSYENILRILDAIPSPNLRLVFDTGNPVFTKDHRGTPPYTKYQSSWEFYSNVKEFVEYIHIKDGYMDEQDNMVYTFPGEGHGDVKKILTDLLGNGYDGGISIEPHMAYVFHDQSQNQANADQLAYQNYIDYGQKIMALVKDIKSHL